jgi:anti-anti-sigma factor
METVSDGEPPAAPGDGAVVTVTRGSDASGAVVLALSGELDLASVTTLQTELDDVVADRPAAVVFDLSALRFMDSSGIAALLGCAAQVPRVQVRNPSNTVRRVIELSGLATTLPMTP